MINIKNKFLKLLLSIIYFASGIFICTMFVSKIYTSYHFYILLFFFVGFVNATLKIDGNHLLLLKFSILVYCLPFLVTIGYLFKDNQSWPRRDILLFYACNEKIISDMMVISLVGLIGLICGMFFYYGVGIAFVGKIKHCYNLKSVMNLKYFVCILMLTLILGWLASPSETILQTAYGSKGNVSISRQINFNASALLSFCLLALLFVDSEISKINKNKKYLLLFIFSAVIIIYYGLLRGDRDGISLLSAFILLYLTMPVHKSNILNGTIVIRKRIVRIFIPMIVIILVYVMLGTLRTQLNYNSRIDDMNILWAIIDGSTRNATWTGILYTNMGMAILYNEGMDLLYGKTYLEYILSLPPGLVTKYLGIVRPLEIGTGPQHWFENMSGGGIHLCLVPFKNFGIFGVLFFHIIIGYFLSYVEYKNQTPTFYNRILYGFTSMSIIFWFWYGDMFFIRTMMLMIANIFVYNIILALQELNKRIKYN